MLRRVVRLSGANRLSLQPLVAGHYKRALEYSTNPFPTVLEYESRWTEFFATSAYDQFELQRGLNHAFSYDIVPTVPVLEAALRACRRLNDYAAAMRVFGALRQKCATDKEYEEYVKHLEPIKQELGVSAPEDIGRM